MSGVRAGDEILAVNDIKVEEVENAVEDLREALKGMHQHLINVFILTVRSHCGILIATSCKLQKGSCGFLFFSRPIHYLVTAFMP